MKTPYIVLIVLMPVCILNLIPTVKYWSIIVNGKNFKSRREVFLFTIFRLLFALCLILYMYYCAKHSKIKPSYFVVLLCSQLVIFPITSLIISLINFLEWICIHFCRLKAKFYRRGRHTRMPLSVIKFIRRYYILNGSVKVYDYLSNVWNKKMLIICYLISGALVATGVASSFLSIFNKEYSDIICNNDLQLYCNLFIITQIPLLISIFINRKGS